MSLTGDRKTVFAFVAVQKINASLFDRMVFIRSYGVRGFFVAFVIKLFLSLLVRLSIFPY